MKKCSISLLIKEIQIKTTLRFHLTPVRTQTATNAGEDSVEKGTLIFCWWKSKLVQTLWKTVWRLFEKPKIDLPYDTAIPL
jgi:hypothetical protein